VKYLYQREPRLADSFFKKGLGKGKTIFMGSCFDLFAESIKTQWIERIFNRCLKFDNIYLFQTKNPHRFHELRKIGLPTNAIYGTTIETTYNRLSRAISKAPDVLERYAEFMAMSKVHRKMVSLEPLLDFSLPTMIAWMEIISPEFISIGADSKGNKLPEPPAGKVKELIQELKKFTQVRIKHNLSRILK